MKNKNDIQIKKIDEDNEILKIYKEKLKEIEDNLFKMIDILEKVKHIEIISITSNSIINICLEDPIYLIFLLKLSLKYVTKGNKKICKELRNILERIFEKIDYKEYFINFIKNNFDYILHLIQDSKGNYSIIGIGDTDLLSIVEDIFFINKDIIKDIDINSTQRLLAPKSDSNIFDEFDNKLNMQILIGNDNELKKDFEELKKVSLEINNNIVNLEKIEDLYSKYKIYDKISINSEDKIVEKLNNKRKIIFGFNLFLWLYQQLFSLNMNSSWEIRVCSVIFIDFILKYNWFIEGFNICFEYSITQESEFYCLEGFEIYQSKKKMININNIQYSIITFLIVNGLIDQVSDFNYKDICLFKELNNSLSAKILNSFNEKDSNTSLYSKEEIIVNLLYKFIYLKNQLNSDWHPLYSLLLFFSKLNYDEELFDKLNFFTGFINSYNVLLKFNQEIVSLANEILLKIIKNLIQNKITCELKKKDIWNVFLLFLKHADVFDDIDQSIENYIICFNYFLDLFVKEEYIENLNLTNGVDGFEIIRKFVQKHFINFSMSLIQKVRETTFKSVIKIISYTLGYSQKDLNKNTDLYNDEFIRDIGIIAYQALCLEEDEEIIKSASELLSYLIFVMKSSLIKENEINKLKCNSLIKYIKKNFRFFYKLHIIENIKDFKYIILPKCLQINKDKDNISDYTQIYKSFFKNDLQVELIKTKCQQKHLYTFNFFADLIICNKDIFPCLLECFHFNLNSLVISNSTLHVIIIYSFYLEKIEFITDKTIFFPEEIFLPYLDISFVNDSYIGLEKKDCFELKTKFSNLKGIICKISDTLKDYEKINLTINDILINLNMSEKRININKVIKFLNDLSLKIDDKSSISINELSPLISKINIKINQLKNQFEPIRILFRGYAAANAFQTIIYSQKNIDKITNYVNSFINILKINSPIHKIIGRLLLRLMFNYVKKEEAYNKILSNFFKNCVVSFIDLSKLKELKKEINEDSFISIIFYPFFNFIDFIRLYESCYDIVNIVMEFFKENLDLSTKLIFLYLLSSSSFIISNIDNNYLPLRRFSYSLFSNILSEYLMSNENTIPENENGYYMILIQIIIELFPLIFVENDYQSLLTDLFSFINNSKYNINKILILLNNLFDKNLTSLQTKINNKSLDQWDFNFRLTVTGRIIDILKLINHNNPIIKSLSFSFFSKLIKTISNLKTTSNSYQALENKNKYLKGFFSGSFQNNLQLNFELKIKLRDYQINGIKWLSFLGNFGLSAALCDDMGLGKSIQTLVTILNESFELYKNNDNLCNSYNSNIECKYNNISIPISLILCPNSLSYNWIKEHSIFFYSSIESCFNIKKVNSFQEIDGLLNNNLKQIYNQPILFVLSYEKIKESDIPYLRKINFFYLVLDEAHLLKNPKTKVYSLVSQIKANRKILLSGTPIQNNLMELYTLFDLIMPGFFGKKSDFESNYNKKIYSTLKKIDINKKLQEEMFQASISEIKKWVKPFILRRIKSDVLKDLPEKQIEDFICEMSFLQDLIYDFFSRLFKLESLNVTREENEDMNNKNNLSKIDFLRIEDMEESMTYIQKIGILMKIINNPISIDNKLLSLFIKSSINYYPQIFNNCSITTSLTENNQSIININEISDKIYELIKGSNSKINAILELFNEFGYLIKDNDDDNTYDHFINNQNKILIFSNFNSNIELIKSSLESIFNSKKLSKMIRVFNSSLSDKERFELVEEFNSPSSHIKVLLLNTSVGGLGLTLTAANIVIMYDHSWNPMKDLQAMDRAHRLGQKKTVQVYRLITKGTLEEKLISLQNFKKFIANAIITYSNTTDTNINLESFMESFETNNINLENKIIEKMNKEKEKNEKDKYKNILKDDNFHFQEEEEELEYLKELIN